MTRSTRSCPDWLRIGGSCTRIRNSGSRKSRHRHSWSNGSEPLGVEDIRTGVNKTGVTGLVRARAHGPGKDRVVLIRADMDALPIHEENDVEYRSQTDGVMHACGHDAHTAILLGVARTLMGRRDQFSGTVKLLFQPSEESDPGGALGMIAEGVLEDPHVDAVFALHMAQEVPCGIVIVAPGPILAAPDGFKITIQGKGGHAARPHAAIDPVVIGSQLVMALQTVVSRNVDPIESCVVTVGAFQAGEAFNVIPDTAMLGGTVRTFSPAVRDLAEQRITEICAGIAEATRAEITLDYDRGYPATVNDAAGGRDHSRSRPRSGWRRSTGLARHRSWPAKTSPISCSNDPAQCSRWARGIRTRD